MARAQGRQPSNLSNMHSLESAAVAVHHGREEQVPIVVLIMLANVVEVGL